jgi:hypothetical protein
MMSDGYDNDDDGGCDYNNNTNFLFCFLDSGDITVIRQFPMHTVQIMWGSQNL